MYVHVRMYKILLSQYVFSGVDNMLQSYAGHLNSCQNFKKSSINYANLSVNFTVKAICTFFLKYYV